METVNLTIEGKEVEYELARRLSEAEASRIIDSPMLVAWFDGKKGEEHPSVPECLHKPGWIAYAEGHGGRVRVDVNDDEYSFIFASVGSE